MRQQRLRFLVGIGGGHHDDVHSPHLVDLVVHDLGEDDLLLEPQRVVAAADEGLGRHPPGAAPPRGGPPFTRRSRNSYIRAPRRVTLQPMGEFSRSLKFAIDFLARVTTGFCPAMVWRSATAKSTTFAFSLPSPTPMLMTIFS